MSAFNEQMTVEEVDRWITAGGDLAMLKAMEIITHHGNPAVAGNWAAKFMADVPAKAKQFRNRMTDKQRDSAVTILAHKGILPQLQTLLPLYIEATEAPKTAPEVEYSSGVFKSSPISEKAKEPEREYVNDELWGAF